MYIKLFEEYLDEEYYRELNLEEYTQQSNIGFMSKIMASNIFKFFNSLASENAFSTRRGSVISKVARFKAKSYPFSDSLSIISVSDIQAVPDNTPIYEINVTSKSGTIFTIKYSNDDYYYCKLNPESQGYHSRYYLCDQLEGVMELIDHVGYLFR